MKLYLSLLSRIFQYRAHFLLGLVFFLLYGLFSSLLISVVGPIFSFLFSLGSESNVELGSLFPVKVQELFFEGISFTIAKERLIAYFPVVLIALSVLKGATAYCQNYLMGVISQKIIRDLRNEIVSHLISSKKSLLDQHKVGSLISLVANDTIIIQNALVKTTGQFFRHLLLIVFYLSLVLWIDVKLTLFCFLVAPPIAFFISKIAGQIENYARLIQERLGDIVAYASEMMGGKYVIKAFAGEHQEVFKFNKYNSSIYQTYRKSIFVRTVFAPAMEFIALALFALMVIYLKVQVKDGSLDISGLFTFAAIMGAMFQPINGVSTIYVAIKESVGALTNYHKIIKNKDDIENEQGVCPQEPIKCIELNKLDYLSKDNHILNKITFDMADGLWLAIVGHSGSGKSTLVRMLFRLYENDQPGSIQINQQDIFKYSLEYIRRETAFVSQDVFLFQGSIDDNIRYGSDHLTEQAVKEVLEITQASFINNLPEGLNYNLEVGGANLSDGQRQRLVLARALLKNASVLILDEATSALDLETEKLVMERVVEYCRKHKMLLITIAHRLNTIKNADKIIVLENGELVGKGNHPELIDSCKVYQHYVESFNT